MKKIFFVLFLTLCFFTAFSQKDTIFEKEVLPLIQEKTVSEGLDIVDEYLESFPYSAPALTFKAKIYYYLGDTLKAISLLRKAAKYDTAYFPAYYYLGEFYHTQNIDSSIFYFKQAHKINRDSIGPLVMLGLMYFVEDSIETAEKYFNLATENKENAHRAYYLISYFYGKIDSLQKAYQYINKAIELNPVAEYYKDKADLEFKMGLYTKALSSVKKAIELKPEPEFFELEVAMLDSLQRKEDAIDAIYNAFEKNVYSPKLYLYMGYLYYSVNDLDSAEYFFAKGIDEFPDETSLYSNFANLKLVKGDFAGAKKLLYQGIRNTQDTFLFAKKIAEVMLFEKLNQIDENKFRAKYNYFNLKKLLKITRKKSSDFYYPKLKEKFAKDYKSLSFEEFFMFYIGSVNDKNFSVENMADKFTLLSSIVLKTPAKVLKILKDKENQTPFFSYIYFLEASAYKQLSDYQNFIRSYYIYKMFMKEIEMSGYGDSELPMIATNPLDVYVFLYTALGQGVDFVYEKQKNKPFPVYKLYLSDIDEDFYFSCLVTDCLK